MDKQKVYEAMEKDLSKSLKAFNSAAADLMTSGYILVMGKIAKLLQSVAGSVPLCDYFAEQTRDYNFVEEFRLRQFRDEYGRPYIEAPEDGEEHVKFVFCMLFAIDTGKLSLENLLHTFYSGADANSEFDSFCNELIRPFVENLNAVFIAPKPTEEEEQPVLEEETAEEYEDEYQENAQIDE